MTAYEHRLGIFRLHADPKFGSPYWISFFARSGISPEDAAAAPLLLPVTDIETLRTHPVEHFISQKVLSEGQWLISGETSGFSGKPKLTMFSEKEFHDSVVTPFILRAEEMGFPV
jgi:phenylacetate-coenzyme A ligase PaaK-like adenylate-forming protein